MNRSEAAARSSEIPQRAWLVLALTSAGQMMATFAGSALNVGFPVIEADLDVERTTLAWSISGYSIAAAALLLVAGRAADRIGGKRIFLGGMAVFTAGAVIAAAAPNVGFLIAGRILQGFGSAAMIPSSLSLALQEFPASRRSLAVATWGAVAAIAASSGPPIGAALIEFGSWRLVFLITIPVGLATVVIGARLLRDPPPRGTPGRVDLISGPLASLAVALVIVALLQSATWGWGDVRVIAALAAAPVLLGFVVVRSASHPVPLLDLALFHNRRFVVASGITLVYNASTGGYWLAAPLFLQTVWGWSVLASGFGIVGGPLTHIVLAQPMGRLADRGHHRFLMVGGVLLTAAGLAGLAATVTETSSFWTTVFPFTILIGAGGAMAWPTFTSAALIDIAPEQYGEANGVNLTMRQLGGALGVAVVVAVIGNGADAGVGAFRSAWLLAAASLAACAAVVALAFPRRN